jgi:hypothetical protein
VYELLKDFAGPFATLCGATAAVLVTYRLGRQQVKIGEAQAETAKASLANAHQRVVLELFDKRWAIVTDLREAVSQIAREGVVSPLVHYAFLRAYDRAGFLFGSEVDEFLRKISTAMSKHAAAQHGAASENDALRAKSVEVQYAQFNIIAEFHGEFNRLIAPYLRMTQKLPE